MIKTIVSSGLSIDEQLAIRKNVISHGDSGKRLCIVTGTHGDELEGQMVCFELQRRVLQQKQRLNGILEVYPALNPLGIDTIQRGIPTFDLDMNRIFPGDPQGTMVEQTAYKIVEDIKGADMVLDIHSSNLYLRETPQVRINVLHESSLLPPAKLLNLDFIWIHDAATVLEATLAHSLNSCGTPCLVVEMGVGQRVNHGMCMNLVDGIFRLMASMGMWTDPESGADISEPYVCKGDTVEFLNAEASGLFFTRKRTGEHLQQGDKIGEIVDPLTGTVLSAVVSPCDGYLFTIRAYPVVYEGSLMARVFRGAPTKAGHGQKSLIEEYE